MRSAPPGRAAGADDAPAVTTASEADNRRRWDGTPGHYEVWFLTTNHRPSQTGAWMRYALEAPLAGCGEARAELWFAHFDAREPARNFAIHRRYPIADMVAQEQPFAVSVGGAMLHHDRARGAIAGAGHSAAWDLGWTPSPRTHHLLPSIFYRRRGLAASTVLSPNLDVAMSGWIEADGRRFELAAEPGCQTHLWGRKHAHAWGWGHCNAFDQRPDITLEVLTAQLRRGERQLPPLTLLTLNLGDEVLRWNRLRDVPFSRGRWGTGLYRFSAASARRRIEGEFSCRPVDMVLAEYADPDGERLYCANTEVGDLRVTLFRRSSVGGRWRESARLTSSRAAHFEVAGPEPDPAIGKAHRRI